MVLMEKRRSAYLGRKWRDKLSSGRQAMVHGPVDGAHKWLDSKCADVSVGFDRIYASISAGNCGRSVGWLGPGTVSDAPRYYSWPNMLLGNFFRIFNFSTSLSHSVLWLFTSNIYIYATYVLVIYIK